MSDALPLPARPNLEQYKKLARELQRACQSADTTALRDWFVGWLEREAVSQGREMTPSLRSHISEEAENVEKRWRERFGSECKLTNAQFFIARRHGFASWAKFVHHLRELNVASSSVTAFERAADAIVSGDIKGLRDLLAANPHLIRERSTREHRSTLLHYVSANGVEDFRQKTPANIVEITKLLLDSGADVRAESDAYRGRSTTLGLTATSWHPENAGVQIKLMDLLIERGAEVDGPGGGSGVNDCLHNGRGEAAAHLAERGAKLDLEGAAGVGRLDIVESFFSPDGKAKPPATEQQVRDAFAWACQFGRTAVAEFLLTKASLTEAKLRHHGQTGLHWASLGGHADTAELLIRHGAPVNLREETFGGAPIDWALYGWMGQNRGTGDFYEAVAVLTRAGARIEEEQYQDEGRQRTLKRANSDPRMSAALRGESPSS